MIKKIKKEFTIKIQDCNIKIRQTHLGEYICITDISRVTKNELPRRIVSSYLREKSNLEFLALWELRHNTSFKTEGFHNFKDFIRQPKQFFLNPNKWVDETNSIGLLHVAGRSGGTYVHRDIAIHMTAYSSAETYFHLIMELQRLRKAEQNLLNITSKIPLDEIIAEANRIRDVENGIVDEG
ncbi:MAG: hypothetical protein ACI85O_000155 [Saprospiraceae bacterium]|jgi:hypothetical protein